MTKIKAVFLILIASVFLIQGRTKQPFKPTVYLVGDSTVKNGRGDGAGGLWGWGNFINQYLDAAKINVENHALGGTSSRTFQDKGLWDAVVKKLQKGDFVLIQFGHNDDGPINDNFRARGTIKGIGSESEEIDNILTGKHETVYSYGWYLRKFVTDAKAKGAVPIIMSPIPRNKWIEGKVPKNDTSYGLWAKQIADEQDVTFVDLNTKMAQKMEILGAPKVTGSYFYERDHTHTSAKGAVLAASIIMDEIQKSSNPLQKYMLKNPVVMLPKKRSLFLIGDSTMANNGDENAVGWGVLLPKYVDTTRVNIINKARGGRSSRSFSYEGLWDSVLKQIQPEDFVIIQFGHNDAGNIDGAKYRGSLQGIGDEFQEVKRSDSILEKVHTYGWYLKNFIKDIKEKKAKPILLSLTVRNEWPNGQVEQRDSSYVKWTREVAALTASNYIDVSDSLARAYQKIGKEKVKVFFPKDHTHTSYEGAEFNAKLIAKSLKKCNDCSLSDYIFIKE